MSPAPKVVTRGSAPAVPSERVAPAVLPPPPRTEALDALLLTALGGATTASSPAASEKTASPGSSRTSEEPPLAQRIELPPVTDSPGPLPKPTPEPVVPTAAPATVPPSEFLPPIPALPDAPVPAKATPSIPPAPLPPLKTTPSAVPVGVVAGPIELNGQPLAFDALSKLVDGNACSSCGGGGAVGGCSTCGACGDVPCRSGGKRCEPFPAHTAAGRVIGMIYSSVCCPDPCYQPKWEPLADAAFFTDAVRPKTSTRFRWDYGSHFAYPDRGEYFFARADGNGRGPKANSLVKAIPYVDYHELNMITEIAMGNAGVQIAVPYRSVNSSPFGQDGAGFADMSITAKTLLLDSELALFGFQMRTYIPIGQTGKGLGTGHVSLEPGLNFGLRLAPETYLQAQVVEWIPIGGNTDYQGAHLRWATSLNHVLWRPIRDVQLVGTLESTGISFQDGLFTDPVLGSQRLAKRTSAAIGPGLRLFFCDTFDFGVGWQHGITGKYLVRDELRFEARYRY
ncbi:transporter [Gemmata sp. G18]|uniref:Transporter n=1 Tax=Gemmata palustris TaxID=2822762 RepID=A0ABS5BYX5_9BACT|nr:transporter [Gemmata palustris]MBP3958930.1 transporter [Gemmata palustris]